MTQVSPRLAEIVEALPLRPGTRVPEIGCGTGVAARLVWQRFGHGHVLAIDRSAKAIAHAKSGSTAELATGRLALQRIAQARVPGGRLYIDGWNPLRARHRPGNPRRPPDVDSRLIRHTPVRRYETRVGHRSDLNGNKGYFAVQLMKAGLQVTGQVDLAKFLKTVHNTRFKAGSNGP